MLEQQLSALRTRLYAEGRGDLSEVLNEFIGKCRAPQTFDGQVDFNGPTKFNDEVLANAPFSFVKPVEFNKQGSAYTPVTFNRPANFNDEVTFGDSVVFGTSTYRTWFPQYVELTTAMTTSATAKFKYWNGSTYADTADATFTVYDPQKLARAALSGQQGWVIYDRTRAAWLVLSMNPPTSRRGAIATVLQRYDSPSSTNGTAVFTDANDGKTFTVYGTLVKSGYRIPTSARVLATWVQGENSGDGRWLATAIDDCLEAVP